MKIRCIDDCKRNWFTVGKIYEVTEKGLIDNQGFNWSDLSNATVKKINSRGDKYEECYIGKFEEVHDFNWHDFKQGNIAVHCDTEEKANAFLKECEEQGITWSSLRKATSDNYWEEYKTCTCYRHLQRLLFGDTDFYNGEGITIIEYKLKEDKQLKFKVGDKVKVIIDYGSGVKNEIGTINCISGYYYGVEFSRHYNFLHGLDGKCEYGYGWYFAEHCLELVKPQQKILITTDGTTVTAHKYENDKVVKSAEAKCCPSDEFDFMIGAKLAVERLEEPERKVKVGDYIKLIHTEYSFNKIGDILQVTEVLNGAVKVIGKNHPKKDTLDKDFSYCYPEYFYEVLKDYQPEQYYNGEVICVDDSDTYAFTMGKKYKVIDGILLDNDNNIDKPYTDETFSTFEDINSRYSDRKLKFIEYKGEAS